MRISLATLLEIVGLLLLAVAAAAWDWRALLALVALVLIVAGNLLEREVIE